MWIRRKTIEVSLIEIKEMKDKYESFYNSKRINNTYKYNREKKNRIVLHPQEEKLAEEEVVGR